ncbi:hypothetical protein PPERSA_11631 [Pseudocohnilembus persalinus]|uniref:Uncharacterized protein n=1 Tax=Pseudocohnilembus persalinus TaxID=266149 RepID=A0A0V0Q9X1_PSEPJ|nr:hypothetical protein PPERSA_11631 [Pseudocohnilembus persalinus]|eukprot:KRW99030.1 hypothetical protein PPERSA_11631 [Pseudocohnilembus persalinus]
MSIKLKESHYNERQFNYSLSTWADGENQDDYKKLKELSKNPLTKDVIQQALQDFGKSAFGPSYTYLSFKASEKDLYGLVVLNLSNNNISEIENLEDMNLTDLNLSSNNIKNAEGLNKLEKLRILNLQNNQIIKLQGLIDLVSIRELWLSNNKIKHIRELQYLENLQYFSILDLCFNPVQTVRYYRLQVLYRLPGLRVLDGVLTTPEEFVKSENLYGLDLEERREIFKEVLPEEEFIDRRINIGELIEPETESDNEENIKFQDKYDKQGNLLETKSGMRRSLQGTMKSLKSSIDAGQGSLEDQFRNTQNSHQSLMNETTRKLKALRQSSVDQQG